MSGIPKSTGTIRKPGGIPKPTGGIPKPPGAISKPTGGIPKPTGGIPKPTGGIPKPTGGIPKPIGAIPKPMGGIPKSTGTISKPAVVIPKTPVSPAAPKSTSVAQKSTVSSPKSTDAAQRSVGTSPKSIVSPAAPKSTSVVQKSTVSSPKPTDGAPRSLGTSPKSIVPTSGVAIPKYTRSIPSKPSGIASKATGIASKATVVASKAPVVASKAPVVVVTSPTLAQPLTVIAHKNTTVAQKLVEIAHKLEDIAESYPDFQTKSDNAQAYPDDPQVIPDVAQTLADIAQAFPDIAYPENTQKNIDVAQAYPPVTQAFADIPQTYVDNVQTYTNMAITTPTVAPISSGTPKYTGTIPKSSHYKTTPANAVPQNAGNLRKGTSQESNDYQRPLPTFDHSSLSLTPIKERRSSMEFTKEALEVINECIKNGMNAVETIRSQTSEISPLLRRALRKVNNGTQAAILFKETISRVNTAIVTGNHEQVLREFQIIMQDVNDMTHENMLHLSEVIYSIYVRKLMSSFYETDSELNKILVTAKEVKAQEITGVLLAGNKIIINALNFVAKMLPERYNIERQTLKMDPAAKSITVAPDITPEDNTSLGTSRKSMNASLMAKKLFILGESLNIPEGTQVENTQMEIRLQSDTNQQAIPSEDGKYRDRLSGFIRLENGEMEEVLLVLKEHIKKPGTPSPKKNANDVPKMLAFIDDEKLDVHEVSFSPRKSNKNTVVFVMEDERTKETHEVEMNLVPSSPNDSASGKIIALIPYSSPGFLSSASEISLVSSSGESPESKAPKSRRLLKKAIILKSKLYPRSPRTKKIIGSPTFKKYNFPSPSQENVRKPLKTLDNWMDEMNNNDAVSLGPEEEEFLDLAVEPSQVPQSQILIEQGKIICKSMKNDLEILKVIDAARFPKQKTPQKQNMSPEQYTESVKETESLREIQNIAIQELIDVLEPIVLLPIESALQFPAPSPSIQSIASSHNDSSILPSASPSNDSSILPPSPIQPVLVSTLDKIMNNSALLREQLNTSIDQMESEIQNSDDRIPEYEKALKIAKIRRETMQKEILESMETLKDGGTNEMMVALVENPLTKERQQVLVELVPTDPSNAPSPGRIVGFFENVESETMPELAPRSMDYSFSEKLTPKRAKHLPNYVTPPKEDDANSTSSEKQAATNNSDPRASKMSANVNKPANIDYNLIENDPNLFDEELELVDDPAEMSAFEQVTKKMHNELVQILDIHSSTLIEEETPNNAPPLENVRKELNFENSLPINSVKEEQAFSQILPNQGYNSSFDLGNIDETGKQFAQLVAITEEQMFNEKSQELINLPNQPSSPVRTLSQPEQESLINFTTPKRSNPVNSKLETQMTDNEIDQLFDEISDELDSLENQTDLLYEFLGTPTQSLKPGQNPFDQFADLVSRVRTSQKLLDDNLISKDSPLGSLIQTGQSPGAQFIQLLPRVLTAEDLISFVDFNGPVQHEQQNIEQAPLVPTQFVPYQNANPNEESITQSPGQCYLQLLPEVLAAEEYLKNACIPSYSTPDQTRDSMQNQSVRSPTKYAQILNQYAAQRDANRSSDRLGQF